MRADELKKISDYCCKQDTITKLVDYFELKAKENAECGYYGMVVEVPLSLKDSFQSYLTDGGFRFEAWFNEDRLFVSWS